MANRQGVDCDRMGEEWEWAGNMARRESQYQIGNQSDRKNY